MVKSPNNSINSDVKKRRSFAALLFPPVMLVVRKPMNDDAKRMFYEALERLNDAEISRARLRRCRIQVRF